MADDQADRIFERMFFAAEMDLPGAGIMYLTKLEKAATYIPSEIKEKAGQAS